MGINVGTIESANLGVSSKTAIDTQALLQVTEKILNPQNEKTVDVSKLDLSKFHRVQQGTDLYSARTSNETALQAAKAATDFDVKLSDAFSAKVQYLNSQAAQSLFTSKERNGQITVDVEPVKQVDENEIVLASTQVSETQNMDKDKKGSNPFAFYVKVEKEDNEQDENENLNAINIFA